MKVSMVVGDILLFQFGFFAVVFSKSDIQIIIAVLCFGFGLSAFGLAGIMDRQDAAAADPAQAASALHGRAGERFGLPQPVALPTPVEAARPKADLSRQIGSKPSPMITCPQCSLSVLRGTRSYPNCGARIPFFA
jgi:hypothetical protein